MKLTEQQAYAIILNAAKKVTSNPVLATELARHGLGIARVESTLQPDAKNKTSTARGLFQMLKGTQKEVHTKRLKRPESTLKYDDIFNADYAALYAMAELVYQYNRYKGVWRNAIHAYNQGSVQPNNKRAFTEGERYVTKVYGYVNATDYAALDRAVGNSSTTAYNQTGTKGKTRTYRYSEFG